MTAKPSSLKRSSPLLTRPAIQSAAALSTRNEKGMTRVRRGIFRLIGSSPDAVPTRPASARTESDWSMIDHHLGAVRASLRVVRPDRLERELRKRLDALGPAPRAELLHVLMLPDFERADR